jgi:acetyl esterase/lipase
MKPLSYAVCVLTLGLLMACAGQDHKNLPTSPSASVTTVTFCDELKMELHGQRPSATPQATVLYIHGGGWQTGDRRGGFERRRIDPLTQNGFVVATIDYRLAPQHKHPAQIHDSKCAIKYLRAHARDLGIDPARIGVMGESAGGHLSAMIGLTDPSDGLEGPHFPNISSEMNAVAAFYGLYDLVNVEPSLAQQAVPQAFTSREARVQGSPVIYIDKDDPPFLIIHGKEDRFTNIAQSVKLAMMLKDKGHEPLLVVVENADHGFVPKGGTPTPDNATIDQLLVAFFLEYLG